MKKIVSLLLFALTILTLSACGSGGSLDFKSVMDTDTNTVYSLGDKKEKFDKAFGIAESVQSDYSEEIFSSDYLDGYLKIECNSDDNVISMSVKSGTNRFKFKDLNFSMQEEDFATRFEKNGTSGFIFYTKYYSDTGKDATEDAATYSATVFAYDDEIRSLSVENIKEFNDLLTP